MNLKDAVAVVTGGGSGLGEATAREFAQGGARIAILDLPNSPGAKREGTLRRGGRGER
jgi:NAD(P)-dependent dehydrogenase (short-subunit alcohol dehydrogenase family)